MNSPGLPLNPEILKAAISQISELTAQSPLNGVQNSGLITSNKESVPKHTG